MLDYAKGLNDAILGDKNIINPVEKASRYLIAKMNEELEKAIKEAIKEGHRYLISKSETVMGDGLCTYKTKYKGIPDIGGIAVKHFEEQGYIIYDLDLVREYCKLL